MESFTFEGVKPEYVQGRFINASISRDRAELIITEFFQSNIFSDKLHQRNISKVYTVSLPEDLTVERVVGKPLCIGCHGNFFLFQFIKSTNRFIRFFIVDTDKGILQLFDDTVRYLLRDFTSVGPLISHISHDREHILLRLNRHIIASRKWSKLLSVIRVSSSHADNLPFRFVGTEVGPFLDKLFQCMVFDKYNSKNIIIALVDEFCSKCKFTIYNMETKKEVITKTHRLGNRSVTIATCNSDDEEEGTYFLLQESCLLLTRSGDYLILCCIVTDSKQKTHLKLYIYNSSVITFVCSHEALLPQLIFPIHKSQVLSWILSTCDTEIQLWRMQRGHTEMDKIYSYRLPESTELKSLCRAKILQCTCIQSVCKLSLPDSIIKYISFEY